MKESRYIELLNLYVDQQLSPVEAAELEAEILKNPARRRTYQQYCRMQKACNRLFEEERAQAPGSVTLSKALSDADRKIVAFPSQSRGKWHRGIYVAGLLGAAACVAFVVLPRRLSGPADLRTGTVATAPVQGAKTLILSSQPAPAATVLNVATVTTARAKPELYTIFSPRARRLTSTPDASDATLATDALSDRASFDWIQRVNLPPLRQSPLDDLAFESRPVTQPENRVFTSRRPVESGTMETIALQFTR